MMVSQIFFANAKLAVWTVLQEAIIGSVLTETYRDTSGNWVLWADLVLGADTGAGEPIQRSIAEGQRKNAVVGE